MTVEIKGVGKVTASKDVLNLLSMLADDSYMYRANKALIGLAKQAKEVSESIYDALNDSGYYSE